MFTKRIEDGIVDDSMLPRPNAGHDGCVAGVGYGRNNPDDPVCIAAMGS